MENLPPFTEPVSDVPSALAAIRARVAEAWRLDPENGGHEAPWWEFRAGAEAIVFLATIVLWLAVVVTVFVTRGPVFLVMLGAAVVLTVWLKIVSGRNCARLVRLRKEALVVPGTWVQANTRLFQPGNVTSYAAFLFAVAGPARDDPALLESVADRIRDEVSGDAAPSDPNAKVVWDQLNASHEARCRVPEAWSGVPDLHLAGVKIDQAWLPRGVMDARICMLLVHPEPEFDSAWWLPRALWWREDVEAVLQPGG